MFRTLVVSPGAATQRSSTLSTGLKSWYIKPVIFLMINHMIIVAESYIAMMTMTSGFVKSNRNCTICKLCSGVVCPSSGCPGFLLPSRALLWSCSTCQNQVIIISMMIVTMIRRKMMIKVMVLQLLWKPVVIIIFSNMINMRWFKPRYLLSSSSRRCATLTSSSRTTSGLAR